LKFTPNQEFGSATADSCKEALAMNLLERVLILAHTARTRSEDRPRDPRIWRVLEAIEQRAHSPPSIAELGAVANLSPSRLSHLFKQQTGASLRAAVNRVRLRAAKDCLDRAGSTLSQAAEAAGFSSPFSFSKWFQDNTGMRPGAYQRASQQRRL
jgi:AraC family transcriptional regulator of arabinose operon